MREMRGGYPKGLKNWTRGERFSECWARVSPKGSWKVVSLVRTISTSVIAQVWEIYQDLFSILFWFILWMLQNLFQHIYIYISLFAIDTVTYLFGQGGVKHLRFTGFDRMHFQHIALARSGWSQSKDVITKNASLNCARIVTSIQ